MRAAATAEDIDFLVIGQAETDGISRMHLKRWAILALVELGDCSCLRPRMPMMERSARSQDQRIGVIRSFIRRQMRPRPESGTARIGGKTTVKITAL